MTEPRQLQPEDRPALNPTFLLRWEETQEAYLLLYPEGVIKLNQSAAEILKLCTGEIAITDIIAELKAKFDGSGPEMVENGIYKFLETVYAKGWIRSRQA